jgi:hypothetical protein
MLAIDMLLVVFQAWNPFARFTTGATPLPPASFLRVRPDVEVKSGFVPIVEVQSCTIPIPRARHFLEYGGIQRCIM